MQKEFGSNLTPRNLWSLSTFSFPFQRPILPVSGAVAELRMQQGVSATSFQTHLAGFPPRSSLTGVVVLLGNVFNMCSSFICILTGAINHVACFFFFFLALPTIHCFVGPPPHPPALLQSHFLSFLPFLVLADTENTKHAGGSAAALTPQRHQYLVPQVLKLPWRLRKLMKRRRR